jgi:hypothetical protein
MTFPVAGSLLSPENACDPTSDPACDSHQGARSSPDSGPDIRKQWAVPPGLVFRGPSARMSVKNRQCVCS